MTQSELNSFLERAADILRGNGDDSEFRGYVFALLFFKRISDVYQAEATALEEKLGDKELAREVKAHEFVVPRGCFWEDATRKTAFQLSAALNEAMLAVERANQPKLDGIFTHKIDSNRPDELPRSKLVELIDHFSSQRLDRAHVPDSLFGAAYECLVRAFASKAGKSPGEFYTPKEVARLMAQIAEPEPGQNVCDWASGSAGLLLQCRRYVDRRYPGRAGELSLYAQELSVATSNIGRINMFLNGIGPGGWVPKREDSLRQPLHLDANGKLMQFDRIVMDPPFSQESWGRNDLAVGDPFDRFASGMPPRDNGDWAWMQHVCKSLKPAGKAVVVMPQGVLFRGQPAQTEEEDGRKQKADSEYVIRENFVKNDLIECVIVLPPKLFCGNNVPGCLVALNKCKSAERKDKILMIWAARDFEPANPQNLLRPSDLMRIMVPWRAFGDPEKCRKLIPEEEAELFGNIEAERQATLKDIRDAYDQVPAPLADYKKEYTDLENAPPESQKLSKNKKRKRLAELKRTIKELTKMDEERTEKLADANVFFDRQIAQVREAAADLTRICSDPQEARRYFVVTERAQIEENEFNLNLPRYVDTFEPDETIDVGNAIANLAAARNASDESFASLDGALKRLNLGVLKP